MKFSMIIRSLLMALSMLLVMQSTRAIFLGKNKTPLKSDIVTLSMNQFSYSDGGLG